LILVQKTFRYHSLSYKWLITWKSQSLHFYGWQMAGRERGKGHGSVPPNPPPPPLPTIGQLLAVQAQLMQQLVQNQQNQRVAGAQPRDKRGEFLKGRPPVFTHAADSLEADDWLRAV
jgi:hypothetical protein